LLSTQYRRRTNFSASIDCEIAFAVPWPCGAVSPMRIVSLPVPWPVSASARQAFATRLR
jgi:hypothetical protein